MKRMLWLGPVMVVAVIGLVFAQGSTEQDVAETHSDPGSVEVLGTMSCQEEIPPELQTARIFRLCDGETKVLVRVAGVAMDEPLPRETASEVAKAMWNHWQTMQEEKAMDLHDGGIVVAHGGKTHTRREEGIFESELNSLIKTGYALFHNPELGTNGISCDMCHPNASNTHPETYPKFQTQLKEVVLLRDMINWCIENPLEGKTLSGDDLRMKGLEAYILSTRKGVTLEFGKH